MLHAVVSAMRAYILRFNLSEMYLHNCIIGTPFYWVDTFRVIELQTPT